MTLTESALNLFGLQLKRSDENKNLSAALSVGLDDEGSTAIESMAAGAFGTYLDQDGQTKTETEAIRKYREISYFAEVDVALQEIVNEAIPQETDSKMVKLNLEEVDGLSESIKEKIQKEFEKILKLYRYDEQASELFKRWYVDGRIPFQIIVDKNNLKAGIQKLICLDAMNVKKMKDVKTSKSPEGLTVIDSIDEYYVYNDMGFGSGSKNQNTQLNSTRGVRLSPDSVIYCTSGLVDTNNQTALSYLNKAIRPINQLRMLEDATVIYFIARAPERKVFYVDVGNLPKLKAEMYLKDMMNRYRNKMVYDAKTGDVKNDKKYLSLLEDFWMPRRDGNAATKIESLPGAQNISGYLDSLGWFKEKVYDALNIPKSRLQSDNGFSLGKSQEISRDEVKFQKFIDRLRNRFGQIIIDALRTQLILTGIMSLEDWNELHSEFRLDFQKDNYFSELKNQEIIQSRFNMLQLIDPYLGKYVSKEWVQREVLNQTEEDIKQMDKEIQSELDDPMAKPEWQIQGQIQQDMQMQAQAQMQPQSAPDAEPSDQQNQ